jgi:hypothetical protein
MKKPNVLDLNDIQTNDKFVEEVKEVKKQSAELDRKTYTLAKSDTAYISTQAVKLSQQRGKVVSASEALRLIIHEHKTGAGS